MEEGAEAMGISYGSRNPGISHKCGHDGHSAALAGLALELGGRQRQEGRGEPEEDGAPSPQDRWNPASRNVYLIFQHGEEVGGGGEECAKLLAE